AVDARPSRAPPHRHLLEHGTGQAVRARRVARRDRPHARLQRRGLDRAGRLPRAPRGGRIVLSRSRLARDGRAGRRGARRRRVDARPREDEMDRPSLDPDTLGIGGAASHAFTPPRFISEEAPPDVLTPAGLIFAAYVLASLGFALVVGGILLEALLVIPLLWLGLSAQRQLGFFVFAA